MTLVIYLVLIAVGFYFGKWLGAIGLVVIYFYFTQGRQLARQQSKKAIKTPIKTTDITWAYQELGVAQTASSERIKQARKRLLNHYHPDKLGPSNEAEKQAADAKITAINEAYRLIKQHKGF